MKRKENGKTVDVSAEAASREMAAIFQELELIEQEAFGDWRTAILAASVGAMQAMALGIWAEQARGLIESVRVYAVSGKKECSVIFVQYENFGKALELPAYEEERQTPGPFKVEFHLAAKV